MEDLKQLHFKVTLIFIFITFASWFLYFYIDCENLTHTSNSDPFRVISIMSDSFGCKIQEVCLLFGKISIFILLVLFLTSSWFRSLFKDDVY